MRYFLPSHRRYLQNGFALQRFFLEEIHRHEKMIDSIKEPTNFMDCYLKDMKSEEHQYLRLIMFKLKDNLSNFSKMTLAFNAGDLWTGGLETGKFRINVFF